MWPGDRPNSNHYIDLYDTHMNQNNNGEWGAEVGGGGGGGQRERERRETDRQTDKQTNR